MKCKKIVSATLVFLMAASGAVFAAPPHDHDRDFDRNPHDSRGPHEGRGAGPDHRFYRGDRLPPEYHNRQYVVENWREHHLSAPPRGYHWVQVGGDYVLAAVATGVIAQLILGN